MFPKMSFIYLQVWYLLLTFTLQVARWSNLKSKFESPFKISTFTRKYFQFKYRRSHKNIFNGCTFHLIVFSCYPEFVAWQKEKLGLVTQMSVSFSFKLCFYVYLNLDFHSATDLKNISTKLKRKKFKKIILFIKKFNKIFLSDFLGFKKNIFILSTW